MTRPCPGLAAGPLPDHASSLLLAGLCRVQLHEVDQLAPDRALARVFHVQALLSMSLAVVLHAPVSIVTDAAGLADHEVGRRQSGLQDLRPLLNAAIVIEEGRAGLFNGIAIAGDTALSPSDAQDRLHRQMLGDDVARR